MKFYPNNDGLISTIPQYLFTITIKQRIINAHNSLMLDSVRIKFYFVNDI